MAAFLSEDRALVEPFVQSPFLVKLANLADMFEHLNMLNQGLQGRQVTLVSAADQIRKGILQQTVKLDEVHEQRKPFQQFQVVVLL